MEEKERYIILIDRQVKDTQNNSQGFMSINSICKTLNLQDKELSKLRASYQQVKEENEQLKQQLAEKDKEIAYMTKQAKKFNNEAQKYYEDAYCNDFQKQTKIDFAVEQLEKLKVELHIIHTNGYLKAIDEEIDNQIKELKGENK